MACLGRQILQAWREYKNISSRQIAEKKYLRLEKKLESLDEVLLEKISDILDILDIEMILDEELTKEVYHEHPNND